MNEEIDQHSKVIKTDVIGRVKIATEDREKMLARIFHQKITLAGKNLYC